MVEHLVEAAAYSVRDIIQAISVSAAKERPLPLPHLFFLNSVVN